MGFDLKDLPQPTGSLTTWAKDVKTCWQQNMQQLRGMLRSYITREQDVPYRWLDGAQIFQKTLPITEVFCTTNGAIIAHQISGFARLVKIEGCFRDSVGWHCLPYLTSAGNTLDIAVDGTNIISRIHGTLSYTSFSDGYVTLWFTKA